MIGLLLIYLLSLCTMSWLLYRRLQYIGHHRHASFSMVPSHFGFCTILQIDLLEHVELVCWGCAEARCVALATQPSEIRQFPLWDHTVYLSYPILSYPLVTNLTSMI
jgi:hypothetical protein